MPYYDILTRPTTASQIAYFRNFRDGAKNESRAVDLLRVSLPILQKSEDVAFQSEYYASQSEYFATLEIGFKAYFLRCGRL